MTIRPTGGGERSLRCPSESCVALPRKDDGTSTESPPRLEESPSPPAPRSSDRMQRRSSGAIRRPLLDEPSSIGRRTYRIFLLVLWLGTAGVGLVSGLEYYVTPVPDRAYSELHDVFKPSGTVGNGFGIIGSVMMLVGVVIYSLRKRVGVLAKLGRLRYWLELHIFLCTLGPFLVLLHTSFKFGGIVSIAFWSMAVVVGSGLFGRYVYARIPKTINGQFLTLQAVEREKGRLLEAIQQRAGLSENEVAEILAGPPRREPRGFLHALVMAIQFDWAGRSQRRKMRRLFTAKHLPQAVRDPVVALARNRVQLDQQIVLLRPFQKLFGLWHMLHLPLAIVMLLIVIVHIAVAALFGYAWAY